MQPFKIGEQVITNPQLWYKGSNVGNKLAKVIDTKGHILIDIDMYEDNPVKVFRYEITHYNKPESQHTKPEEQLEIDHDDINSFLDKLYPWC